MTIDNIVPTIIYGMTCLCGQVKLASRMKPES